jgi:serine/threonine protein phosphatase PrpC
MLTHNLAEGHDYFSFAGVSHLPEVRCVDLAPLSQRTDDPSQSSATPLLSILLATDGVWDNWTYEDVATFLLDPSCTSAVMQDSQGARRVLQSFMSRNAAFARRNFGSQADNASGVLVYLSADPTLPV